MSLGHGLLMVLLAVWMITWSFMHGDETLVNRYSFAMRRTLLPESDKPPRDHFRFINTAYDLQLIDKFDADGAPLGNQVITDRAKLGRLFDVLAKHPEAYDFVICDIFFEEAAPNDSLLHDALRRMDPKKCILVEHRDREGKPMPHIFHDTGLPAGVADFSENEGEFLKFSLMRDDTTPYLPLQVYQIRNGATMEPGTFFWQLNGKSVFNDFVLDMRMRPFDLFEAEDRYPVDLLGDLTAPWISEEEIVDLVQDRFIIVGDFAIRDQHNTAYGEVSGPLILANIYYAITQGDPILRRSMLIFLFIAFSAISYLMISTDDFLEEWIVERLGKKNKVLRTLLLGLSYMVIFGLISLITFLFYSIHINFVILTLYFGFLEWAIIKFKTWRKAKNPAQEPQQG